MTGEIPAQGAGSLVRFRLIARSAATGTWPREGDGTRYGGTVVADPSASKTALPRLQWFLPDDVWEQALAATRLQGNDGTPAVMAFGGTVIDNVTIRIKGHQARNKDKKKWKVMLPAGHTWNADGLLRHPVDQFDLLPASTDKSFSREILVSDMQQLSGGLWQQVFPLRLERNNEFFGLYMYGESPEGDWRDLNGFSDQTYVWKAEILSKLQRRDSDLEPKEFRQHYERLSMRWLDDNDQLLRDMMKTVSKLSGEKLIEWAYRHVDIPQVVEALATMRIVQHPEWQHKNYLVAYDAADERWRLIPIDFDLAFGKRWHQPCGASCDDVVARTSLGYPGQNKLAAILLDQQPFRSMVDRRTRELSEVYLAEGRLEQRMGELLTLMGPDSVLDRRKWFVAGAKQTMKQAQQIIIERFLPRKRSFYIGERSLLPTPQPKQPKIDVVEVTKNEKGRIISFRLVNRESMAIDVSNRTIEQVGAILPAGVVLPAEGGATFVFERKPLSSGAVTELTVQVRRPE